MVYSKSKNGIKRKLLYNEFLLLVDKEDHLSFEIKNDGLEFTINFTFSSNGPENTTSGSVSDDGKVIDMTLYKWESTLGVESTNPIEFTRRNSTKRVWIKFKTSAESLKSFRSFHLTVWGEV